MAVYGPIRECVDDVGFNPNDVVGKFRSVTVVFVRLPEAIRAVSCFESCRSGALVWLIGDAVDIHRVVHDSLGGRQTGLLLLASVSATVVFVATLDIKGCCLVSGLFLFGFIHSPQAFIVGRFVFAVLPSFQSGGLGLSWWSNVC